MNDMVDWPMSVTCSVKPMLLEKQAIPLRKFQSRQAEGECDPICALKKQCVFLLDLSSHFFSKTKDLITVG